MMDRWVMKGEKGWESGDGMGCLTQVDREPGLKYQCPQGIVRRKKRETKKNELQADMLCEGKQWGERGTRERGMLSCEGITVSLHHECKQRCRRER